MTLEDARAKLSLLIQEIMEDENNQTDVFVSNLRVVYDLDDVELKKVLVRNFRSYYLDTLCWEIDWDNFAAGDHVDKMTTHHIQHEAYKKIAMTADKKNLN